jgi:hypothetical protein
MTSETAVRMVEITQRKANELFEELIAELRDPGIEIGDQERPERERDLSGYHRPWAVNDLQLAEGGWMEIDRSESATYDWPDGSTETFEPLVTYTGTGLRTGITVGLGYSTVENVVGFVSDGSGRRALTLFFPADDMDKTDEMISMIRGGGETGRAGFGPADSLPDAYQGFETAMLRDRVEGKWNRQAVVAKKDDFETMLDHTAIQAKLRGLI